MDMMTPIEFINEEYSVLLNRLKSTDHGMRPAQYFTISTKTLNPYHLEGDVLTHTLMVYSHISKLARPLEFYQMSAMLHDIGKIDTRAVIEKDNGKKVVRFANHEGLSFLLASDILKAYSKHVYNEIAEKEIKACLFAIANHGVFKDNQNMLDYDYAQNALRPFDKLSLDMLSELITADRKGRLMKADVKFKDIDVVGHILDAEHIAPLDIKETYHKKEMVMMIGLPRSGKSTYIKTHLGDYYQISRDALIMESCPTAQTYAEAWNSVDQKEIDEKLMKEAQSAFKTEDKIVIDMTNMSKKSRKKWLTLAKRNAFFTKAYVMGTDVDTCVDRSVSPTKPIPEEVIWNMAKRFTFPLGDEFDFVDIKV